MKKAVVLLAPGFEEVEAVSVIDVLRRGGVQVSVQSVTADDDLVVESAHQVFVKCDKPFRADEGRAADVLVLPGGQPGTNNLKKNQAVLDLVKQRVQEGSLVAAICAAPLVLLAAGVLGQPVKKITSFPAIRDKFDGVGVVYVDDQVVQDKNVITSRGVGTALAFALHILAQLTDQKTADTHKEKMLIK